MIGSQAEDEIATVLKENKTLLKLGYSFDSRAPQVLVDQCILRNNEMGLSYIIYTLPLLLCCQLTQLNFVRHFILLYHTMRPVCGFSQARL